MKKRITKQMQPMKVVEALSIYLSSELNKKDL